MGAPLMTILKFITEDDHDVYIVPTQVCAIEGDESDDQLCFIYTTGGIRWLVRSRAGEAQLRVWKALEALTGETR